MRTGGDASQGFKLNVDQGRRVLRLEVWGLWTDETARDYDREMHACYAELGSKQPWYVLADIKGFPPQRESVAAIHGKLMAEAAAAGMVRAVSVVESSLTSMQIRRIATESRMPELAFHKDEAAALKWLLSS